MSSSTGPDNANRGGGHAERAEPKTALLLLVAACISLPIVAGLTWGIAGPRWAIVTLITGGIVLAAAVLGLSALKLIEKQDPTPGGRINARLAHVVTRLLLTAAGLIGYLLTLPESQRRIAGFIGIGWYVVTWAIDFYLVRDQRPQQRQESLHCPAPTD
jgi:hypothetical protein